MWIRILSALLGLPLLIFVLILGGNVLTIALITLSLTALWEFYCIFETANIQPFRSIGMLTGAIISLVTGVYGHSAQPVILAAIISCTLICFILMIIQNRARIADLGVTLIGLVYISLIFSMLHLIYFAVNGPILLWLVFIIAWLGDTFAYFIGISLGRHKLCPKISPNKSIEGAAAGLVGSVFGSVVFWIVIQRLYGLDLGATRIFGAGLFGGIMAQLGDLAASVIKRYANSKDFGKLIPGHGGILDRFDSVLFVIPVVYYISTII